MKFTSDDSATRHLTPKKYRCVWMEAGILSYLLCDREFDCDHCPLDEAMRSHLSSVGKKSAAKDQPETSLLTGPSKSRSFYTPDHLKVTVRDDGTCRLSLEPGIARILPPVRSVVLPRSGDRISPDAFCCWLILEGGTLPVKLPFGGTIEAANLQLGDRPHLVNGAAPDEGWFFDFTPDDRNAVKKSLLSADDAEAKYIADLDMFRRLAMECLHPEGARVGHTLQDGGRLVDDLSTMIGPVKYLEILRRVFWANH